MKNKKLYFLLLLGLPLISAAQDIHFSQFYNSPLTLNPANAGIIKGDFRVNNNYREQWKSVASSYKTYSLSCDAPLLKEKIKNGSLGFGVSFFNDRAGDIGFNTNQINLTLAGNISVNERNNISIGLQGGIARQSIDVAELRSINQFDGVEYHSDWATGETQTAQNYSYADFGMGMLWNFAPTESDQVHIGVAMFHMNSPAQSFYDANIKANPKLVIHAGGILAINESLSLVPDILFLNQGESFEINTGTLLRYEFDKGEGKIVGKAMSLGGSYRFGDAIIFTAVVEITKWKIGFSYDVNTSGLNQVSKGQGGYEISLTFMTPNTFQNKERQPSFL